MEYHFCAKAWEVGGRGEGEVEDIEGVTKGTVCGDMSFGGEGGSASKGDGFAGV